MRITKLMAVTGAVAFCAAFTSVRAADTDNAAQAAARAAVLAAMQDTNATPALAQPAAAPVAPAPVQPAVVAPVVVMTNSPITHNADQAAAMAALQQALQTTNAPVVVMTNAPTAAPAVLASPVPMTIADQLQALNAKYKANQITPMDYFTQREALLKNQ